jgi:hypothetical protein
MFRKV